MAMIDLERIAAVLTPWLGSELISRIPRVLTEIQRRLSVFTAGQSDLGQLAESLDGLIYTAVRKETDASFLITLSDQSRVRMETEDFTKTYAYLATTS